MLRTVAEARAELAGRSIALVPTMGALHEGHLSLVRLAREHADEVAVSIFVNPLQFGAGEDFDRYPRTLESDIELLQGEGVEWVFAPTAREMYPASGAVSTPFAALPPLNDRVTRSLSGGEAGVETQRDGNRPVRQLSAGPIGDRFEGAARPGHFDGMLTVVNRLFDIIQPAVAVFGQKDAQQLALVEQMVAELGLPVRIVAAPISREPDGLARSSRNRYLTSEQRASAHSIWQALQLTRDLLAADPNQAGIALEAGRALIRQHPQLGIEYFELVDRTTFRPAHHPAQTLLITAVRAGTTRLLDNLLLES